MDVFDDNFGLIERRVQNDGKVWFACYLTTQAPLATKKTGEYIGNVFPFATGASIEEAKKNFIEKWQQLNKN